MNNISHANDEVLVNLYSNGCDEAFDVLLDRYKTRLYDYVFNLDKRSNIRMQTTYFKRRSSKLL